MRVIDTMGTLVVGILRVRVGVGVCIVCFIRVGGVSITSCRRRSGVEGGRCIGGECGGWAGTGWSGSCGGGAGEVGWVGIGVAIAEGRGRSLGGEGGAFSFALSRRSFFGVAFDGVGGVVARVGVWLVVGIAWRMSVAAAVVLVVATGVMRGAAGHGGRGEFAVGAIAFVGSAARRGHCWGTFAGFGIGDVAGNGGGGGAVVGGFAGGAGDVLTGCSRGGGSLHGIFSCVLRCWGGGF